MIWNVAGTEEAALVRLIGPVLPCGAVSRPKPHVLASAIIKFVLDSVILIGECQVYWPVGGQSLAVAGNGLANCQSEGNRPRS